MADMLNLHQMVDFKKNYQNLPTVCYINSTAEVKAECDICCTSSNAIEIVKSLNVPRVLFVPDANLGKHVESQLNGVEVITYNGCCPVHDNITVEEILNIRKKYQLQ
jgi:quinolinate synthase